MVQMTDAQRQQLDAVAEQVAAKLKAFHDTLPADEQAVLAITIARGLHRGGEHADDRTSRASKAVAEAFAAQADVHGHAIMIGGEWFSTPGNDGRHEVPPNSMRGIGRDLNPPRLPGQPKA